ncbi:MAG: hypothetical protein GEV07_28015 [Streptosporangiales bacterium]|nr:hypothetical protein [Streptosporangiales bacterium]
MARLIYFANASTDGYVEHEFDLAAISRLKESSARDITVGGPELAAEAITAGLVDEIHLLLAPIVVGAGNQATSTPTTETRGLRGLGPRKK